ncbi:MAG: fumarylacetoacetate hydrolase family protein [Bowdeniella nasicola]|nr:fumarylacetoacetate hydrolase family protein [Bowdeniella nasicola]
MKIARYTHQDHIAYGVLDGDELVQLKSDPLFAGYETVNRRIPLADVRLLSPVIPRSKVVGIGKNYADHASEMGGEVPAEPLMFFVPNTAVIGPDDPIVLPEWESEVHHEAELAVVISRPCRHVPVNRAAEVIFGYTCANDVSARGAQRSDRTWARAKGFDTSCPLGPFLVVAEEPGEFSPEDAAISARVDGETRQSARTCEMVYSVAELISYVSSVCSLLPGDVIMTGTPAGVGPLEAGQRVEVEIEGIGTLTNPVVRR